MTSTKPWPCPLCAEVIPFGNVDCPFCRASGDWIDLIGALDFSMRRYELWKLEGGITNEQYHRIADDCRRLRQEMVASARTGLPVPADTGLPTRSRCWHCQVAVHASAACCPSCNAPLDSPEVRLLRFQAFLCQEIRRHSEQGRLSAKQWDTFLTETPERQIELLERLEQGWTPLPSK